MTQDQPVMKDVLVIVPFPMSEENLAQRRAQMDSVDLSDELRFTFRSTKAAPRNYVSEADMVLADVGILEVGQSAQDEGFHAVCIDTMSDSGVAALRSVLDIPVIGPGRASMLTAMLLAGRFRSSPCGNTGFTFEKTIGDLGIQSHVASIGPLMWHQIIRRFLPARKRTYSRCFWLRRKLPSTGTGPRRSFLDQQLCTRRIISSVNISMCR